MSMTKLIKDIQATLDVAETLGPGGPDYLKQNLPQLLWDAYAIGQSDAATRLITYLTQFKSPPKDEDR